MVLAAFHIVKRPLITEKSTWEATRVIKKGAREGQPVNRYAFEVQMQATKPQIRAAIQSLYNVRVERVSTQVRKGRSFRTRHGMANTGTWKRAVVQLHADDRIELF